MKLPTSSLRTLKMVPQQPAWGRSREFEITTRTIGRNGLTQSTTGDLEEEELDGDEDDELVHGRRKRKVAFMPSLGEWHPANKSISASFEFHRHDAYHLLPWTLATCECGAYLT